MVKHRPWFLFVFFGLLVVATRAPSMPGQLFTFDDVNLSYAAGHFDIRSSQPQPPGYPLFVMEMRALEWLHFRRAESVLHALGLLGATVALLLVVLAGGRILGGESGYYAAWLLVFHPVFWHASLTSALRVQLAVISVAVGWACWRAFTGEGRWVLWSALALGTGAGIRPEAGPLLFPLWAASALRAKVSWRYRAISLAAMGAAVLAWLLPAMFASGGPSLFVKACLDYITDQASVSSGLFGASESRWAATFWQLMTWTFCGVLGWPLAAVLAWRRGKGFSLGRQRAAFLALWIAPALAFALTVHVEDPGQTLLIIPVVCLVGGFLIDRATANAGAVVSAWDTAIFAGLALIVAGVADRHNAEVIVLLTPVACLAAALVIKVEQVKNSGLPLRAHIAILLLAPALLLNLVMFYHTGWYYRGSATSGVMAEAEHTLEYMNSGLALTSYEQIAKTLALDDGTVREVRHLAADRPGKTWVIWEEGPTAWRKIVYYAPALPVAVMNHKKIRSGSPPVVAIWNGSKIVRHMQGAEPLSLTVPAGARIVWVLWPKTEFWDLAQRAFPMTAAGAVWYTDLPPEHGARILGEYEINW